MPIVPRSFRRMILGQPARGPQRPPVVYDVPAGLVEAAKRDPRVRHDVTAGGFVVADLEPVAERHPTITPVDPETAAALADDLRAAMGVRR